MWIEIAIFLKMDFQELLSLGLGGAAIAILYVFGVSFILLLICCLFLIFFISKLWIKNLSTEQTIEENLNLNTHTVAKVSSKQVAISFARTLVNCTTVSRIVSYVPCSMFCALFYFCWLPFRINHVSHGVVGFLSAPCYFFFRMKHVKQTSIF